MKRIKFLFFAFCAFFSCCRYISAAELLTMTDPINFGDIVQIHRESSVVRVSHNGIRTMTGAAATKNLEASSGYIVFRNNENTNKTITISPVSDTNVGGCSAKVSNFVFSQNPLLLAASGQIAVNIGATLTINGFCSAGTYNGNVIINYDIDDGENTNNGMVNLPFMFSVDVPLSLSAETDLDFGSYVSPQTDEIIIVDANGSSSGGLVPTADSKPHVGVMLANGVSGRSASVELSEKNIQLMNGKESISAELNISPSTFIFEGNELVNSSQIIVVGGKVYVKANQPIGEYRNTVYITIFYND